MKPVAAALSIALLSAALTAQVGNEVIRNNQPWLVRANATSTATGQPYNWAPSNPPEYSQGSLGNPVGVPADTWSWRVLPREANWRAARRLINGFVHEQFLSGETVTPWSGGYLPQVQLMAVVARPSGPSGAIDPDWNKVLLMVPEMPMPANSQHFTVTRQLASAVSVPTSAGSPTGSDHLALGLRFRGGESQWTNGAHGYVASLQDGPTPYTTWGFYYAPTNTTLYASDPLSILWASYLEAEPTLAIHSDWGQRRASLAQPFNPPLLGHSLATYWSDVARFDGSLGFSVRAANHPGAFAVILFNFGSWAPLGGPFLGQTVELNPADPNLTLFASLPGVGVMPLDASGVADGLKIAIPASPSWAGTSLGFEALIVSPTQGIVDSSGSAFVQN